MVREAARFLIGPPLRGKAPPRARAIIKEAQDQAEVAVSAMQILAVATFAVLYELSPKAFPPDVAFEPVPVTLAFYSTFTAIRLVLAIRRALPRWFLGLSVVVDIVVLMVTIWTFHIQYQMDPAFYLKSPTLMYVFILISLRALRFDPEFVLLTGVAAAVGWSVLVSYAVLNDPDMAITRSFVDYVNGPRILLGAEFDKIISILAVTFVLTIAVARARTYLVLAVAEGETAQAFSKFFAPEVAGEIAGGDLALEPGSGQRREVAVLFADLRGFTKLTTDLPATQSLALLSAYHACVTQVVRAHGGVVDKFMGDGVLASFGGAGVVERPAAAGFAALEALSTAWAEWRRDQRAIGAPDPAVGASLAVGPVMVGVVGGAGRLEHTIIGDAVNFAAKLEKHNKVEGSTLIASMEAWEAARVQGFAPGLDWSNRSARMIEGVADPRDLMIVETGSEEARP